MSGLLFGTRGAAWQVAWRDWALTQREGQSSDRPDSRGRREPPGHWGRRRRGATSIKFVQSFRSALIGSTRLARSAESAVWGTVLSRDRECRGHCVARRNPAARVRQQIRWVHRSRRRHMGAMPTLAPFRWLCGHAVEARTPPVTSRQLSAPCGDTGIGIPTVRPRPNLRKGHSSLCPLPHLLSKERSL